MFDPYDHWAHRKCTQCGGNARSTGKGWQLHKLCMICHVDKQQRENRLANQRICVVCDNVLHFADTGESGKCCHCRLEWKADLRKVYTVGGVGKGERDLLDPVKREEQILKYIDRAKLKKPLFEED